MRGEITMPQTLKIALAVSIAMSNIYAREMYLFNLIQTETP